VCLINNSVYYNIYIYTRVPTYIYFNRNQNPSDAVDSLLLCGIVAIVIYYISVILNIYYYALIFNEIFVLPRFRDNS